MDEAAGHRDVMTSIAQTWFQRVASVRSSHGLFVGSGVRLLVFRLQHSASMPICRISVVMCFGDHREAFGLQQVSQHARPASGSSSCNSSMRHINLGSAGADRLALVKSKASAAAHELRLTGDQQGVVAIDHHLALSMPALISAPPKKFFEADRLSLEYAP